MPFKIKDLMINDLSEPGGPYPNRTCNPITRGGELCLDTTNPVTPINVCFCTYGSGGVPLGPFDPGESLTSLRNLKEQLQQQLDQIEKRHSDLEKNLAPQTVEQADALREKLEKALDDLKEIRAELVRAAKKRG